MFGGDRAIRASWKQVSAFRLSRHHLLGRGTAASVTEVAGDIAGAQAQLLSAAQISIWTRTHVPSKRALDDAIWKDRTLARAWCMRRTMFLVPSEELAIFVRGTARRPEYNYRWALERVSSRRSLDGILDGIAEFLDQPHTRNEIAHYLKSNRYKTRLKAGGGWGDSRAVHWVEVGGRMFTIGFLIHAMGAREAICSGPNIGSESTYVRAERWIPRWKDVSRDRAEDELLKKYLGAFGPSTLADFAFWMGIYVRDVKEVWSRAGKEMTRVEVEGWQAEMLEADASDLERAELDGPKGRLLPNFDTFMIGHKSHRSIVDERYLKKVYRNQGWVSPVILYGGEAVGVWSHHQRRDELEVRVTPFSRLSADLKAHVQDEASELGQFLGSGRVRTDFLQG